MSAGDVLRELRELGATVALTDGALDIDAPPGVLTKARLARLRIEKPALVELMQDEADYFDERAAIREYDGGFLRAEAEVLARSDIARMAEHAHRGAYG
jgi:hypothetical protein